MQPFRRLGIFLNDEPGDDEALALAAVLARSADSESIICVHVRGIEEQPEGPAPDPDDVRRRVLSALPAALADQTTVEVVPRTGLGEVLRSAHDYDLDIIVIGRRQPHDQLAVGAAFHRLARKAPCSVLAVPDQSRAAFSRVLVLVDGSEHSKIALETAAALVKGTGDAQPQIVVQSIYQVGYGYKYSGMSLPQASHQVEHAVRKKVESVLAQVELRGIDVDVVYTCSEKLAEAVYDLANARHLHAVVLGSRGMTSPAAALLGPTAERVLVSAPLPVLIVKRKGETLHFLDALLGA